jgi:hypothetical protein
MAGCRARHPNDREKCLVCDTELGYYAIGAERVQLKDGKFDVYQICQFYGSGAVFWRLVGLLLHLWAFFD